MRASATVVSWPQWLTAAVATHVGRPAVSAPLHSREGTSLLLRGPMGRAVLKSAAHERERRFYAEVAPRLGTGVVVPHVYGLDEHWLLLEHLETPLPEDRRLADPAMMRLLAALHRSAPAARALTAPIRHTWSPDLTSAAVARLPAHEAGPAYDRLEQLRPEADAWLDGDVLVSADTAPDRWGTREGNELVLFGWSRVGLATPAVDVAMTVPGLPSRDQLELVAGSYLDVQERDHVHWSAESFVRGVTVLKAWQCVLLLAQPDSGPDVPHGREETLIARFSSWLSGIP